jgi:5-methylthioadenosine/S-adenosylhomocysteine deaminase
MKVNLNKNILIARGKWIIPGGSNPQDLINDGAVVMEGNKIKEVDSWEKIKDSYPNGTIIGSDNYAIIPGLINGHHHNSGVTSIQQNIPDKSLDGWLLSLAKSRDADPSLVTFLAAARQLKAGVTSVVDISPIDGTAEECSDYITTILKAYDQIGMRVAFTIQGPREMNHFVFGDNETFMNSLPIELREKAKQFLPSPDNISWEECFTLFDERHRQYRDHSLIEVWLAPEGPAWVSEKNLSIISDIAKSCKAHTQTHVLESIYENPYAREHFSQSMVSYLKDVGFLGNHISLAHMTWSSREDMKLLADSGTSIVHNPGSNLRLRNGIAPLREILHENINVSIGMDGLSFNDDDDIWAELRLALRLSNLPYGDAQAIAPQDIFKMATNSGAKLLGLENDLGELAVGRKADIVLINLERITWPWTAPESDPLQLLINRTTAKDVDTVLVDGKIIVEQGKLKTVDEKTIALELAENLKTTSLSSELSSLIEMILPKIADFYSTKYPQTMVPTRN